MSIDLELCERVDEWANTARIGLRPSGDILQLCENYRQLVGERNQLRGERDAALKEISGVSDKVVILGLRRSLLTSGRADATNIPAPSILKELEENNRILKAERDAAVARYECIRQMNAEQFSELFAASLKGTRFDDMVDAAIDAARGEK